jgi:hypothetical protein
MHVFLVILYNTIYLRNTKTGHQYIEIKILNCFIAGRISTSTQPPSASKYNLKIFL